MELNEGLARELGEALFSVAVQCDLDEELDPIEVSPARAEAFLRESLEVHGNASAWLYPFGDILAALDAAPGAARGGFLAAMCAAATRTLATVAPHVAVRTEPFAAAPLVWDGRPLTAGDLTDAQIYEAHRRETSIDPDLSEEVAAGAGIMGDDNAEELRWMRAWVERYCAAHLARHGTPWVCRAEPVPHPARSE